MKHPSFTTAMLHIAPDLLTVHHRMQLHSFVCNFDMLFLYILYIKWSVCTSSF